MHFDHIPDELTHFLLFLDGFVSVTSYLDEALSHVNAEAKSYKKKDGRDLSD